MASVRNQVTIEFIVTGGGAVTIETQNMSSAVDSLTKTAEAAAGAFDRMGAQAVNAGRGMHVAATASAQAKRAFEAMQLEWQRARQQAAGLTQETKSLDAATSNLAKTQSSQERATALQARKLNNLQDGFSALIVSGTASRYEVLNSIRVVENWTRVAGPWGAAIGVISVVVMAGVAAWKKYDTAVKSSVESARTYLEMVSDIVREMEKAQVQAEFFTKGMDLARGVYTNDELANIERARAQISNLNGVIDDQNRQILNWTMEINARRIEGDRIMAEALKKGETAVMDKGKELELENKILAAVRVRVKATHAMRGVELAIAGDKARAMKRAIAEGLIDAPKATRGRGRGRRGKPKYPYQDDPTLEMDLDDTAAWQQAYGATPQGNVASAYLETIAGSAGRITDPLIEALSRLDLMLERLGNSWVDFSKEMQKARAEYNASQRAWAAGTPLLEKLDAGMADAAVGALIYGESFKAAASEVANAIFAEATGKAFLEGAYALASLAFGDFAGAALHGKAAASFAATAAVAAGLAGATGGFSRSSGGGGGGGGDSRRGEPKDRDMARGKGGPSTTIINVNNFDGHFYATQENALRGLGDAAMRGINMRARGQMRIRQDAIDYNAGQRQSMRQRDMGRR